jgi:rhomboid protease GluP
VRIRRPRSVTSVLLGSNVIMFAVELALGSATSIGVLVALGAMVPSLIAEGQYWRLITSMFLHVGVLHLVLNLYVLYLFGHVLESVLGSARFAAVYFITGFWGSAASFAFGDENRVAAGASGAIFGLLGAWLAYNWRRRRLSVAAQGNIRVALVLIGVNLVLGVAVRGIDNAAHLGGLAAGLAAGLAVEGFGRGRVRTASIVGGLATLTVAGAALVTWRVTAL